MISLDFKKIISYFKGRKEKEIFDRSLRDWKKLIILFSVFALLLWLVDGYLYFKNTSFEGDLIFTGDEKFETINRDLLSETIKNLDDRERQMAEKFSAPNLPDPSI